MNQSTSRNSQGAFGATVREAAAWCKRGVDVVLEMPWPQRLAVCFAAAFLLALLPMALTLFVLLLAYRLLRDAFASRADAAPRLPQPPAAHGEGERA